MRGVWAKSGGSVQRMRGVWAKSGGVWAKNGGVWAGLVGPGGWGGTCRSHGNVGIVLFRSKERARRDFVAKSEGVWAKNWGVWAKNAFGGQKANFRGQRKCIMEKWELRLDPNLS